MNWGLMGTALLAAAGSAACNDPYCTTSVEPGIVVEIRDSNDLPVAEEAVGRVSEGTFTDSLRAYESTATGTLLSRAGADEREGIYVVEVSHPGFTTWRETGVQVTGNGCHVETVRLQAQLIPAP